jgi:hypothetical protein
MGKAVLVIAAAFVAIYFFSGRLLAPSGVPERPSGVPADAVWAVHKAEVGNVDAPGEWIACTPGSHAGAWSCSIYDVEGARVHYGTYLWTGTGATSEPPIRYRDGNVIRADGGDLTPVGRHFDVQPDGREQAVEFGMHASR